MDAFLQSGLRSTSSIVHMQTAALPTILKYIKSGEPIPQIEIDAIERTFQELELGVAHLKNLVYEATEPYAHEPVKKKFWRK